MHFQLTPLTIVLALVMGGISATIAHRRGRSPYWWFFTGFAFGLIGLLAIFFIPPKKAPAPPTPEPVPSPQLSGPTDKFWYYLDSTHAQQGPMSFHAITKAFDQGHISPSTYVWHDELSDWKPLEEFLKV